MRDGSVLSVLVGSAKHFEVCDPCADVQQRFPSSGFGDAKREGQPVEPKVSGTLQVVPKQLSRHQSVLDEVADERIDAAIFNERAIRQEPLCLPKTLKGPKTRRRRR